MLRKYSLVFLSVLFCRKRVNRVNSTEDDVHLVHRELGVDKQTKSVQVDFLLIQFIHFYKVHSFHFVHDFCLFGFRGATFYVVHPSHFHFIFLCLFLVEYNKITVIQFDRITDTLSFFHIFFSETLAAY